MNLSHVSDEDLWFELEIRKQLRYYLNQRRAYGGKDRRIEKFIDDLLLVPIIDVLRRKICIDTLAIKVEE